MAEQDKQPPVAAPAGLPVYAGPKKRTKADWWYRMRIRSAKRPPN